jgi:cell division septation protein DedD
MAGRSSRALLLSTLAIVALGACQPGQNPLTAKPDAADAAAEGTAPPAVEGAVPAPVEVAAARSVKLVDRDVEAPEVFQVTDEALWDGRPSLGGVWVASPDAVDPERVILRNAGNGKFVIGALFRRERDNPGPKLQISSDAAAALGLLAGQPARINVTALRREEVPTAAPDAAKPILDASEAVQTTTLDTAAVASAAIDKAAAGAKPAKGPAVPTAPVAPAGKAPTKTPAAKAPAPQAAAPAAAPSGGLIQIGIFSVEANAKRAVEQLAKAGIPANLRREESQGKAFWSVTAAGNATTLGKIKAAGFADAYALKRG